MKNSTVTSILPGFETIAITGASSGLGAALARHYAQPGRRLCLAGRNAERLHAVAQDCRERGAEVSVRAFDVGDAALAARWIAEEEAQSPIGLLIANAGISAGTGGLGGESAAQAAAIFATNVAGVLNVALPASEAMRARGRGHIAIIGSMAGLRGLPGAPAYSASKAAIMAYGAALRGSARREGVRVSVVCPGYIRTPMTADNPFPMPLLMDVEQAAARIARGIARGERTIAFPLPVYGLMRLLAVLPPRLSDAIFSRLPAKPAGP